MFGNKSSFAYTRKSGIIVGAMAVEGNAYDGHTLRPQLDQVKELTGGNIKKAIVDRGYKIKKGIGSIDIVMPKMLKKESYYLKKKREERCRSRAGMKINIGCLSLGRARILFMPGELIVEYKLAAKRMRPDLFVAMAAYGDYATGYICTDKVYKEGDMKLESQTQ